MLSLTMTLKEAESSLQAREYDDALAACRKALSSYNALPVTERLQHSALLRQILELRCDTYTKMCALQDAVEDAAELCRQFPERPESFFRLGDLARRAQRFREATEFLRHALHLNAHMTSAKVMLNSVQTDLSIQEDGTQGATPSDEGIIFPLFGELVRSEVPPVASARKAANSGTSGIASKSRLQHQNGHPASTAKEQEGGSVDGDDDQDREESDEDDESRSKEPGPKERQFSVFNPNDAPHWVVIPLLVAIGAACFLSIKTFAATAVVFFLHHHLERDVDIFRINGVPLSVFSSVILACSFIF